MVSFRYGVWILSGLWLVQGMRILYADELELKREREFSRCYSLMVGRIPPADHPVLARVRSGQTLPVDACMEIFNRATLIQSGGSYITTGEASPQHVYDLSDARGILESFNTFHRNWFTSFDYAWSIQHGFPQTGEWDMHDRFEAANQLGWALFSSGFSYQNLLRGVRSVEAVRESFPVRDFGAGLEVAGKMSGSGNMNEANVPYRAVPLRAFRSGLGPFYTICDSTTGCPSGNEPPALNARVTQVGVLRGFQPLNATEYNKSANFAYDSGGYWHRLNKRDLQIYYERPYGGGAIGTHSYLLLNMGFGLQGFEYPRADGGIKMARRWSKSVFHDFMCRDLPVAQLTDGFEYVRPSSNISFRKSASCMSCHATIDGMAGAVRNLAFHSSAYFNYSNDVFDYGESFHIGSEPVREISAAGYSGGTGPRLYVTDTSLYMNPEDQPFSQDSDANWNKKRPKAWVIFRDYKNDLVSQVVENIEGVGQALTSLPDYYICAAARYFKFFTNKNVSIQAVPTSDPQEELVRQDIIRMGLHLQSTQNLRELISDILHSDAYREGLDE